MEDFKLHIVATANQNVKIDAYWFGVGDKIDCYLTPHQFKTYIDAFETWDILAPSKPKPVVTEEIIVEKDNENDLSEPKEIERNSVRKNTKKVAVQ